MSKRNSKGKISDKNPTLYIHDREYLDCLQTETNLSLIDKETNKFLSEWEENKITENVQTNVENFKFLIKNLINIITKANEAISIFIRECETLKKDEKEFASIQVSKINSLDKGMSQLIKSIKSLDEKLQSGVISSTILEYHDTLNFKIYILERQSLSALSQQLQIPKATLNDHLTKLITHCFIILSPTTETLKSEKREASTKSQFILRIMCSKALDLTIHNIGIKDSKIYQESQDAATKVKLWTSSTFEFHNKVPKIFDFDDMLTFEYDLALKNTSLNKDRPKVDRDNAVAAFRYYIRITLQQFRWNTRELNLNIETRPFVIISQTSQTVQANANMTWYKHFGDSTEKPWCEFKKLIQNYYFENTERCLTSEQLNYLRCRFLMEKENSIMSLQDLLTKKFPEKKNAVRDKKAFKSSFTPWHWFVCCINSLKSDKVCKYWKEGLVYGFISKIYAEKILEKHEDGTFLVRFAESKIEPTQGATPQANFTLATKRDNEIYHLQDFLTFRELDGRKLDLFATLNEMKINGNNRGEKLVANGQVILSPAEGQEVRSKSFTKILKKNEVKDEEDEYNATRVNYEVVLGKRGNRFRNDYKNIPEFSEIEEGFEPPTPGLEIESPSTFSNIDIELLDLTSDISELMAVQGNMDYQDTDDSPNIEENQQSREEQAEEYEIFFNNLNVDGGQYTSQPRLNMNIIGEASQKRIRLSIDDNVVGGQFSLL